MLEKIRTYIKEKKHWIYRNIYYRLKPSDFYRFPRLMASMWYAYNTGALPNLRHPKNVNELWIAINLMAMTNTMERTLRIRCADKYAVRDYVREKGFGDSLNECYGVYNSFDEIDFDNLPNQFVIKMTTGSAMYYICKDKSKLDVAQLRAIIERWFEKCKDFGLKTAEWHYVEIKPRLIVEKYLSMLGEDLSLVDYKWHCFNGHVYHVETISERDGRRGTTNCDTYTVDWQRKECVKPCYHINRRMLPRPLNLEYMKYMAEKLSEDFEYVRVDMYEIDGKVLFGELTFTPAGCIEYDYYDEVLRDMCRFYYATKK